MAVYACVWLCRAMYGYVGLCMAVGTLRLYTTVGWDGWKRTRAAWGQDGKKARKIST